jgi:hypothetical protein
MLRTDLIDVINSGDAWAFVGSGPSVAAGCPNWSRLVTDGVAALDDGTRSQMLQDKRYQRAHSKGEFATCFSRIEQVAGRGALEGVVGRQLVGMASGSMVRQLADWPFAGYVTTNYDNLLEAALAEAGQLGWLPVGNSQEEVRKVSGDATHVVWHVHGGLTLPTDRSRLVLTDADYDAIYLDGSPLLTQLRALLVHRRLVFIGFGFQDPEVVRMLKIVGRFCSPARPAFAFLSGFDGSENQESRLDFLEKYNVDIIPYRVVDGSHEQLAGLLDVYSAFVLRRSLRFGQRTITCPSYDPETTGLLVYNQLVLRKQNVVADDVLSSLLKSRVLSLLKYRGPLKSAALADDLAERARLAGGEAAGASVTRAKVDAVTGCINDLSAAGLVTVLAESTILLSPSGESLLSDHAALAKRMGEQFSVCLRDRARQAIPDDQPASDRVADAAESFLKDCIQRRALGVAMSWLSSGTNFKDYHIVALLQALPLFMSQLTSPAEALALTRLVRNLLARPDELELKYLGTALQAQFGVNVLGYSPETVRARASEFARTLFLIDASMLIPLLGRSSVGYPQAQLLLSRLNAVVSPVGTTDLLVEEVAEHARWAIKRVGTGDSALTAETFAAATGKAGSRSNVFLEGFLRELEVGAASLDFGTYLDAICGDMRAHRGVHAAFVRPLELMGIPCRALNDWEGFTDELWAERDEWEARIAGWRKEKKTFTHPRQVKAEAEALIIVERLRDRAFRWNGAVLEDAYFVSNTRAIDRVANATRPITMRPELVLQWLSTVTACGVDELGALVDGLLWELTERGLSVVDPRRIATVFSPLISASREKLQEELAGHRELVASRYGEPSAKAFSDVSDLDVPLVVESYHIQKSIELEQQLQKERKAKEAAQAHAKLSDKDRSELAGLRAQQKGKQRKARSKQRAAASRPRRRRKKKRT